MGFAGAACTKCTPSERQLLELLRAEVTPERTWESPLKERQMRPVAVWVARWGRGAHALARPELTPCLPATLPWQAPVVLLYPSR